MSDKLPRVTSRAKEAFDREIESAIQEDGDRAPLMLAYMKILEEENPVLLAHMKEAAQKHADSQRALFDLVMLYALLHYQIEEEPHVLH